MTARPKGKLEEWVERMIETLDLSADRVVARLEAERDRLGVKELPVDQVMNILKGMAPLSETLRLKLIAQVAPELAKLVRTGKSRIEPDDAAIA